MPLPHLPTILLIISLLSICLISSSPSNIPSVSLSFVAASSSTTTKTRTTFTTSAATAPKRTHRINPQNHQFLDQHNRTTFLHGLNVVYKEAPYIPRIDRFNSNDSFCEKDAQLWKEWGFNVARLYVAWQGVFPYGDSNSPNQTYVKELKNLIQLMNRYDIHVILDLHQDLGTRFLCGEGMPDFVAKKSLGEHPETSSFPMPLFWLHKVRSDPKTGYKLVEDCLKNPFFEYYMSKDVGRLFQDLYENKNGMQEDLAQFWGFVAKEFSQQEGIIGYELFNEPWAGDIYSHPTQIIESGLVDRRFLAPMYDRLHKAIREHDDESIIFYEPMVSNLKNVGFDAPPGGDAYKDRSVFSYHIYCIYQDSEGNPKSRYFCDLFDDSFFHWREEAVSRIGGGGMLTEYGALSNSSSGVKEIEWMLQEAESRFQGHIYWQYKYYADMTTQSTPPSVESLFSDDGELKMSKLKALSRTYVQAVCGDPLLNQFHPDTSQYKFAFSARTNCGGAPLQLYLNQDLYYENGYDLQVTPSDAFTIERQQNYVLLHATEKVHEGMKVELQVTRK